MFLIPEKHPKKTMSKHVTSRDLNIWKTIKNKIRLSFLRTQNLFCLANPSKNNYSKSFGVKLYVMVHILHTLNQWSSTEFVTYQILYDYIHIYKYILDNPSGSRGSYEIKVQQLENKV